jgi:hypothetical protein
MFRRYASFGATTKQLDYIFSVMILPMILYNCCVFYTSSAKKDQARCQAVIRKCSCDFSLDDIVSGKIVNYSNTILNEPEHPFFDRFVVAASRKRFLLPRCRTERKRKSYIFSAIKLLNK